MCPNFDSIIKACSYLSSTESNFIHQNLQLAKSVEWLSLTPKIYLVPRIRIKVQNHTIRITLIGRTLMNHHDAISAAVVRKLNYLGRQAKSDIAANTAMLSSTKERGAVGAR